MGLVAAGLVGVALRIARWADPRSLWIDEVALALNVLDRSFLDLLRPLDANQAAPPLFLWATKLCTLAFGGGERALRLVPCLAGIAALFAFFGLARRALPAAGAGIAIALFAVLDPLVEYGAQVKPYAVDALATVLLLRLCLPDARGRAARAALLGAVLVWCSYPAVLVAAAVAVSRLVLARRARDGAATRRWLAIGGAWAASFAAQYLACTRAAADNEYLTWFWSAGFVPRAASGALEWIGRTALGVFEDPLGLSVPWLALPVALLGVPALLRCAPALAVALLALAACCLLAAALRLYPFATSWTPEIGWCTPQPRARPIVGRLAIFAAPALLCAIGAGAGALARVRLRAVRVAVLLALSALLLCGPLRNAWTYRARAPELQELGQLFDGFVRERRAGDVVFLFNSALHVEYLRRRTRVAVDGVEVPVPLGRSLLAELERLPAGTRCWILAVSQPGMDWVAAVEAIIQGWPHLVRGLAHHAAPGAAVFLCERL